MTGGGAFIGILMSAELAGAANANASRAPRAIFFFIVFSFNRSQPRGESLVHRSGRYRECLYQNGNAPVSVRVAKITF
jgi:hypothetical protein